MESCEDELLQSIQPGGATEALAVEQNELSVGMTPAELAVFTSLLRTRRFASGETVVRQGDKADFEGLATTHPNVYARLLNNIAVSLVMKLRLATEHLNLLSTRHRRPPTRSEPDGALATEDAGPR